MASDQRSYTERHDLMWYSVMYHEVVWFDNNMEIANTFVLTCVDTFEDAEEKHSFHPQYSKIFHTSMMHQDGVADIHYQNCSRLKDVGKDTRG